MVERTPLDERTLAVERAPEASVTTVEMVDTPEAPAPPTMTGMLVTRDEVLETSLTTPPTGFE